MKFELSFDCDNAAFDPNPEIEIARLLREITERVESGTELGTVRDINGNLIGNFRIVKE